MSAPLSLDTVSRLPAPGDNCAIATRRLEAGTRLAFANGPRRLPHTVLEGHRFAVRPIAAGEFLLSWRLPFGRALAAISTGDYVCNRSMLEALAVRRVEGASFPAEANFTDHLTEYVLDRATFRPAPDSRAQPPQLAGPHSFLGYRRPGTRGIGTRNYVVILGTTSRTASFARQLTLRLQPLARVHPGIDGIVAIAHTEGGGNSEPNNRLEVLRALAGFIVHPNVAAVLAVDQGMEPITNARLAAFMRERGYPLDAVPHAFLSLTRGLAAGFADGEAFIRSQLGAAAAATREPHSLRHLKIALQCGGSDAFSGVSGNPLAGAIVHELIGHGGCGVLTETDEIMGAENYMFAGIRDFETANAFSAMLDRFRQKMAWHGLTAESNPSAGNKFRGLYNIAIKSLGAVHKKDPRTRLDTVIEYAEPLREIEDPAFTFMNGPGNDLEGVSGQVAAGCNLIIFVTGNGSITNFPFVPTLKVTTTTRRHQLLQHEMDINAGRYLDGEAFPQLVAESFRLTIATASGRRTQGEHAGHSQVSIWRNWRQTDTSNLEALRAKPTPDGVPLLQLPSKSERPATATERVALILPTSMCSTQIARLAAERLNANGLAPRIGVSRFVTFAHTEGCGFGGETMYRLLERTYLGYLTHPNVRHALLLEHGCEKLPNDVMRRQLERAHAPLDRFGWASVQLDGGIEKAIGRIEAWFERHSGVADPVAAPRLDPNTLTFALLTEGPISAETALIFAELAQKAVAAGGSVLIAESDPLLADPVFRSQVLGSLVPRATLSYGQPIRWAGLHVVGSETDDPIENLTGFGANGAHLALAVARHHSLPTHPLVPLLQIAEPGSGAARERVDTDLILTGNLKSDVAALGRLIHETTSESRPTAAQNNQLVDFQLTRGSLGLTT
jgi:altronate dehydratase